ncbi:glycosyltransferase family 9 protein [Elizabethkingia meningoseptica]|uniref:glycosyltransferase family 9 protein n=1 Tax=Elizabethkingia meningoseptica TaxID=238 RepID=UPI00099B1860|nr:glycosyltransferase family 9 protein [Elizabethkingia meningoseptica]MEC4713425.1 glycosyltransferase family 9 protein [Elizabethkingia meningoseptica]
MKTILAYRFSAFGDVAMTVPVFREFLEQNKDVRIIMVSRKGFAGLFSDVPGVEFVGIDVNQYKGILGMRRLAKELFVRYNPDFIADLHDVIRSKILYLFFKRRGFRVYKINKGKEEKEELTDVWNLKKHQLKKTTERYADVLRGMGFPVQLSHQYRPLVSHEDKSGIGFAPFAQHKGKMMPVEKSFELVRELAKNEHVYFFGGGASEVEILSRWEKEIPNTTSLAGKLNLSKELEEISKLRLMISMDSANMHLASLVGTRVVSVWGATHPYAGFLGYGQKEEDVVEVKDLTCRPCSVFGDKECYRGDWACLEELKIQQIIDKVKK